MEIAIIADRDTMIGFKLAGISDSIEFAEENFKNDLETFKSAKILVVTEEVGEYMKSCGFRFEGYVVEIPNKRGSTGHAHKEMSKLFEAAIGVKLKGDKS